MCNNKCVRKYINRVYIYVYINKYTFNLIEAILEKSERKIFQEAFKEWHITNDEDSDIPCTCVCGKEKIFHLFTIQNEKTNEVLIPIGSKCIEKFKNSSLNDIKKILVNKNKIFKNEGRMYDGLTYRDICTNHKNYVEFLKSYNKISICQISSILRVLVAKKERVVS